MAGQLPSDFDDGFGPDEMLDCYASGVFPMAGDREDEGLRILRPRIRAVLPLDAFHVPRRLQRTVRQEPYRIAVNTAFDAMVSLCAEPTGPFRDGTWISRRLQSLYLELHREGFAHSVECWDGERLAGGLFGVSLNGAFFGESMASRVRDASKIALVHLVARLNAGGFRLLDCQFQTDHLSQFGTEELTREDYVTRLDAALDHEADFQALPDLDGASAVKFALRR
jgi:leucyl/phenylalanyl-tRNA---protein transferase